VESHHQDYTFSTVLMARIKVLLEGSEAAGISQADWAYETCKTAGLVHNWSPYTEVRAVTGKFLLKRSTAVRADWSQCPTMTQTSLVRRFEHMF